MNQVLRQSLLPVFAMLISSAGATETISYVGYSTLTANNGTFNGGSSTWPSGITLTAATATKLILGVTAAASINQNGTGTPTQTRRAKIHLTYAVSTNAVAYPTQNYVVIGIAGGSTSASAVCRYRNSKAYGKSLAPYSNASTAQATTGPTTYYAEAPPADDSGSGKASMVVVPPADWINVSSGKYAAIFYYTTGLVQSFAVTSTSTGSGNFGAAGSSGTGTASYDPNAGTSYWTSKTFKGSTNSFLDSFDITIMNSTNTMVADYNLQINGGVTFPLDGLSSGTYSAFVTAPGALRKKVVFTYNGTSDITGLDFNLYFGDIDGDNYVSISEYNYVLSEVGASTADGDSYWGDASVSGFKPYMADLNSDGVVDQSDVDLITASEGLTGD